MKMHTSTQIAASNVTETREFTFKADQQMVKVLTDSLYTRTALAVLRELMANAIDANVANPDATEPPTVELTTSSLTVTDHGMGMEHEFVMSVYSCFFASDKRDSNEMTGAFGLGSKSPLAVADQFHVVTTTPDEFAAGTQRRYVCGFNDERMPFVHAIGDEPVSLSHSGTEVHVAFNTDTTEMGNAIETLMPVILLNNVKLIYSKGFGQYAPERLSPDNWEMRVLSGTDLKVFGFDLGHSEFTIPINDSAFHKWTDYDGRYADEGRGVDVDARTLEVVMGAAIYEITYSMLREMNCNVGVLDEFMSLFDKWQEYKSHGIDCRYVVEVPLGSFSLPPSRETISTSDRVSQQFFLTEFLPMINGWRKHVNDNLYLQKKSEINMARMLAHEAGQVVEYHELIGKPVPDTAEEFENKRRAYHDAARGTDEANILEVDIRRDTEFQHMRDKVIKGRAYLGDALPNIYTRRMLRQHIDAIFAKHKNGRYEPSPKHIHLTSWIEKAVNPYYLFLVPDKWMTMEGMPVRPTAARRAELQHSIRYEYLKGVEVNEFNCVYIPHDGDVGIDKDLAEMAEFTKNVLTRQDIDDNFCVVDLRNDDFFQAWVDEQWEESRGEASVYTKREVRRYVSVTSSNKDTTRYDLTLNSEEMPVSEKNKIFADPTEVFYAPNADVMIANNASPDELSNLLKILVGTGYRHGDYKITVLTYKQYQKARKAKRNPFRMRPIQSVVREALRETWKTTVVHHALTLFWNNDMGSTDGQYRSIIDKVMQLQYLLLSSEPTGKTATNLRRFAHWLACNGVLSYEGYRINSGHRKYIDAWTFNNDVVYGMSSQYKDGYGNRLFSGRLDEMPSFAEMMVEQLTGPDESADDADIQKFYEDMKRMVTDIERVSLKIQMICEHLIQMSPFFTHAPQKTLREMWNLFNVEEMMDTVELR